jgi:hypothetical protein
MTETLIHVPKLGSATRFLLYIGARLYRLQPSAAKAGFITQRLWTA